LRLNRRGLVSLGARGREREFLTSFFMAAQKALLSSRPAPSLSIFCASHPSRKHMLVTAGRTVHPKRKSFCVSTAGEPLLATRQYVVRDSFASANPGGARGSERAARDAGATQSARRDARARTCARTSHVSYNELYIYNVIYYIILYYVLYNRSTHMRVKRTPGISSLPPLGTS
jgi:hypothetical protein